jgi:hypothetical protein
MKFFATGSAMTHVNAEISQSRWHVITLYSVKHILIELAFEVNTPEYPVRMLKP